MTEVEKALLAKVHGNIRRRKIHVGVSLTENCPLSCDHCIVSATKGSFDRSEMVERLSDWLLDGIQKCSNRLSAISFTGGESPLADVAFYKVGQAAKAHGICGGLVTSGYWGKSYKAASSFLEKYDFLTYLTVSIDEYHIRYLDIEFPLYCLEAAFEKGLKVAVRYTGSEKSDFHQYLIALIEPKFGEIIEHQDIVSAGRASHLENKSVSMGAIMSQCPSDGPHISAKGNILPCCSNIISSESNSVLSLGNILDTTFDSMLDSYLNSKIMQIIRVWGWDHIVQNVPSIQKIIPDITCMGACHQCAAITLNPTLIPLLSDWLTTSSATLSQVFAQDYINECLAEL